MVNSRISENSPPKEARKPLYPHIWLRIAISALAAVVLALVLQEYAWIKKFDLVALALLVIVIIPWLSPIIESIKLGDLEITLQKQIEEVKAVATQAKGASDSALAQTSALNSAQRTEISQSETSPRETNALKALEAEYSEIRNRYERNYRARVDALTKLFGKMQKVVRKLDQFDQITALQSSDDGKQLAGIAFAHQHPKLADIPNLIDATTNVNIKGVNQYWALKALRDALSYQGVSKIRPSDRQRLKGLREQVKEDSARRYELNELLLELPEYETDD